ncbi:MAG: TonB-dependent receptor domain-containing protein [Telluria sp.]
MTRPARHKQLVLALMALGPLAGVAKAEDGTVANVVVVTGARSAHSTFDMPASVDVVDANRIHDGQMRVNASESLVAVPGVVVQNRQNYAQDLQISSRGFGARSQFGVRGVRLIADGIPATMPDGQGQAATFNLDMAERIEVLRGPFSALYGNHAGGVIQLFTRDGKGPGMVETNIAGGSYGTWKADVNAQGEGNGIGYVIDGSRFRTDGYRSHSAATRDQSYAKFTMALAPDSHLTIVGGTLEQNGTQDPLGVTWATFLRDPRAGEIDVTDTQSPKRTLAERYNTRKSIDHQQIGATWEKRFGTDRLNVTVYGGNRRVIQYQSFSKAFQAPPTHSGGVVDFGRTFEGIDANWLDVRPLAGGTLRTTAGIEYGGSDDARKGYENFIGDTFGVKGKLRRDEEDDVSNLDPYLQSEWQLRQWEATAGLRHSRVKFNVDDHYLANGNDSGTVNYSRTTPVVGLLYKLAPRLNVYASAARGFETPTLNEVFYSGTAGGFNFGLKPATSVHTELGAKTILGADTRIDAAIFQVRTNDELIVDSSTGGRTSYRNGGRTLRQGLEMSLDTSWAGGWSAHAAGTVLRAIYDQAFGNVPEGSRLPGTPNAYLFGEVAWHSAADGFASALETVASAKVHPDDANADVPAPGYTVFNARVQGKQDLGRWQVREFVRVNNLLNRQYVGSVIVGDTNKRFYEAAPGRNWMAGVSARYRF